MKFLKILPVAFFLSSTPFAAFSANGDEKQALVLTLGDGSQTVWYLNDHPKVTFTGSGLTLESASATINYPLSDVRKYVYTGANASAVSRPDFNAGIRFDGDKVSFSGLAASTEVIAYAADGRKAHAMRVGKNGSAVFSLASLPMGTYVIHYGSSTCKLLKK